MMRAQLPHLRIDFRADSAVTNGTGKPVPYMVRCNAVERQQSCQQFLYRAATIFFTVLVGSGSFAV